MRVLSIQSSVAFGHAGNSAAVFPLQRLGHDVYYVEDSARYPYYPVTYEENENYRYAAEVLDRLARQFGFERRWSYCARFLPGTVIAGSGDGVDRRIDPLDALDARLEQLDRGNFLRADAAAQLDGRFGQQLVVRGHGTPCDAGGVPISRIVVRICRGCQCWLRKPSL